MRDAEMQVQDAGFKIQVVEHAARLFQLPFERASRARPDHRSGHVLQGDRLPNLTKSS